MKKMAIVVLSVLLTACASSHNGDYIFENDTQIVTVPCHVCEMCRIHRETADTGMVVSKCPCSQKEFTPCRCAYQPDPCREVLRPRLDPTPVVTQPRRRCPADEQTLNCGCGDCQTFKQSATESTASQPDIPAVQTAVSEKLAMPEIYILAANRTLNRFLKDTTEIYGKKPDIKIFVKNAVPLSKDLPAGINKGTDNFAARLNNTYTFVLTDTLSDADYYVETVADWLDTPSKTVPAIQYKTMLFDKEGTKINEWVEVLKKTENSRNWL